MQDANPKNAAVGADCLHNIGHQWLAMHLDKIELICVDNIGSNCRQVWRQQKRTKWLCARFIGVRRPNNLDYATTQIWMTPCARTLNSSLIGYKAPRRGILTNSDGFAHIEDLARSLRLWEYVNGNLPEHICACFRDALAMQLDPQTEI